MLYTVLYTHTFVQMGAACGQGQNVTTLLSTWELYQCLQ